MSKQNRILSVFLVLQIALAAVILWPRPAAVLQDEPLLGDISIESITSLTIEDSSGEYIKMSRGENECALPEADDFPCEQETVDAFLVKLSAITTNTLVTETPSSQSRLKVADDNFENRVELEISGDDLIVLYFGSSPSYGSIHVRRSDQQETFLTTNLASYEINPAPSAWIDTSYLSLSEEDILSITVENLNGTFTIDKDEDESWILLELPPDRETDLNKVNRIVNFASNVRMIRPLGTEELDAYGLDQPSSIVTIETQDGPITLMIGDKDPDTNNYILTSSESDYFVEVSEPSVKDMVENVLESFLLPESTPVTGEGEG